MPPSAMPTVPHILSSEVLGVDGSAAWGMAHPGLQTVDLWVQDQDRCNMARMVLDRARCVALAQMLGEMALTLQE